LAGIRDGKRLGVVLNIEARVIDPEAPDLTNRGEEIGRRIIAGRCMIKSQESGSSIILKIVLGTARIKGTRESDRS
jgi:hypothetical protein